MSFTRVPKISIFIQQGRLVALIHVKFGTTNGHVGPLGHTKFHAMRFTGVGTQPPKYQKNPFFAKESPHRGEHLDRFLKFLRAFTRPTILH